MPDNAVLLLPHPRVKLRDSWLVLSSTAGHSLPHRFESWKPENSFIIKFVPHTKSHCLFPSSTSQTVRRAHPGKWLSRRTSSCNSGSLFNLGAEGQLQVPREEGELTVLFFFRHYSLSWFDLGFTHNQVWKRDLTWMPLLQKIMTKRTFLVFWHLSQ